jgi:hypothetical protein
MRQRLASSGSIAVYNLIASVYEDVQQSYAAAKTMKMKQAFREAWESASLGSELF